MSVDCRVGFISAPPGSRALCACGWSGPYRAHDADDRLLDDGLAHLEGPPDNGHAIAPPKARDSGSDSAGVDL